MNVCFHQERSFKRAEISEFEGQLLAISSHRYVHSRIDSYSVSATIGLTKAELRDVGIVMRHVLDSVLGAIAII